MHDSPQKLLMIFHRPPFPLIGGDKIRMHQNLKILSKLFNVDVLFINDAKTDNYIKDNILKLAKNIYVFEFKKYKFYLSTLSGLFLNKNPLQVNYYYFKSVQKWIDKNLDNYDLVFSHTIRSAEYVKNKKIYKVVDFVDAISMNYEKAANKSNFGLWKLLYKIDKKRVLKYELELLTLFNKKIIISETDKNYILKRTNIRKNVKTVQNAVEIKSLKTDQVLEKNYIVFVGKMDYEPNISAVKYFSHNVFPKILEEFPEIKFYIVGANPTPNVKALSKKPNITVSGYVEDIDSTILSSKLVVAPMVSGAGIQNKIIKAMGLKKCVITTKIGAEGLENLGNDTIIISNSSSDFALKTISLLKNKDRRNKIGNNAYNYISKYFSLKKVEKDLLSVFKTTNNAY